MKNNPGMKLFDMIVWALLIIGGLNWGLVGIFQFDVVKSIFGDMTPLTRFIYFIVGIAALYDLLFAKIIWKRWDIHFKKPVTA